MAAVRRDFRGMTLLELLIVIAIVGILAAVALPSFNDQVVKARRADARNSLFRLANQTGAILCQHRELCLDIYYSGWVRYDRL